MRVVPPCVALWLCWRVSDVATLCRRPTEATSDAQVAAVWLAKAGKTGPGTKGRTPPMDSEDAAAEHA